MNFTKETLKNFLEVHEMNGYIHASNYLTKLTDEKVLARKESIDFLLESASHYYEFHTNFDIANIEQSVQYWNKYLNFVRQNNKFTSQSKFESTILEEVMYRIFKEFESDKIKIGGIKAFSNMFFSPSDFDDFKEHASIKINTKNQDFAIYKKVEISITDNDTSTNAYVPIVAMECKTYLNKTMLEGSVATAEKIKNGNPYCRFCIVTERYNVDKNVDVKNSRIDQIYILKKNAKKSDEDSVDIASDVVKLLYNDTKKHLNNKWTDIEKNIKEKGIIFD